MRQRLKAFAALYIALFNNSCAEPKLSGPDIWETLFVPALVEKFYKDTANMEKITNYLTSKGGTIVYDHGATRTADPKVYKFLLRLGDAFGLKVNNHYTFKSRHLEAVDMHIPGKNKFKWLCTRIKYYEFSPKIAHDIEQDFKRNRATLSEKGLNLLERLEQEKGLNRKDAIEFVHEVVYNYLKRHGHPLPKSVLHGIETESAETVNALLLGPDFNHIAISINDLNIKQWPKGKEIEIIHSELPAIGIPVLDHIQADTDSLVRQTSALAELKHFPTLSEDSVVYEHTYPSKYIEFIERGGSPEIFTGFIAENANEIYSSTSKHQ